MVLCVLLCSLQYAVQFKERRLKIDTRQGGPGVDCNGYTQQTAPWFETTKNKGSSPKQMQGQHSAHVAGTWSETKKMFLGGSFLKLADDDV